ncbi:hypothetical protein HGRIS_000846 [Hohenbuehelia grisea]|uniref:Uncharacterized protein n=1 Tax=Hohenbuehelia grisea TaxID=104357 RepID=A0ABR3IPX9_9AGAR
MITSLFLRYQVSIWCQFTLRPISPGHYSRGLVIVSTKGDIVRNSQYPRPDLCSVQWSPARMVYLSKYLLYIISASGIQDKCRTEPKLSVAYSDYHGHSPNAATCGSASQPITFDSTISHVSAGSLIVKSEILSMPEIRP